MLLLPITDSQTLIKLLEKDDIYAPLCNISDKALIESCLNLQIQQWFVLIEKEEIVGIFLVTPGNGMTLYFHAGLYKQYRNKHTSKYLKACLELYAPKKNVVWLTTQPEGNTAARKIVESMGFIHKATIPGGYSNKNMLIFSEV